MGQQQQQISKQSTQKNILTRKEQQQFKFYNNKQLRTRDHIYHSQYDNEEPQHQKQKQMQTITPAYPHNKLQIITNCLEISTVSKFQDKFPDPSVESRQSPL